MKTGESALLFSVISNYLERESHCTCDASLILFFISLFIHFTPDLNPPPSSSPPSLILPPFPHSPLLFSSERGSLSVGTNLHLHIKHGLSHGGQARQPSLTMGKGRKGRRQSLTQPRSSCETRMKTELHICHKCVGPASSPGVFFGWWFSRSASLPLKTCALSLFLLIMNLKLFLSLEGERKANSRMIDYPPIIFLMLAYHV